MKQAKSKLRVKNRQRKLSPDAVCPCGSEKRYKECCLKRGIKWTADQTGSIGRIVPLSAEALAIIKNTKADFKRIFGRAPKGDDPLMFQQYLSSDLDHKEDLVLAMQKAGIDPCLIHAYLKTGLIITEENHSKLTGKDLADWDAAIAEYESMREGLFQDRDDNADIDSAINDLLSEFEPCLYILGMVLHKGNKSKNAWVKFKTENELLAHNYSLYCITRSFKTLKAISTLLDNNFNEDALNLTRSIYENYLNLVFIQRFTDKAPDLVTARLGLVSGTHEYAKTSKGKIDLRTIIDKNTGQKYEGHISTRRMAEASTFTQDLDIQEGLYEFLSRYTHPNVATFDHYFDDNGFTASKRLLITESNIYSLFFSCLVLDMLLNFLNPRHIIAKDVMLFLNRVKPKLIRFFEQQIEVRSTSDMISLRDRTAKIAICKMKGMNNQRKN